MRYEDFRSQLEEEGLEVFSFTDIQNLFPDANLKTVKNNLSRWLKKDYISRIRRELYQLSGREVPDFYLANRIYSPSYVSLETALSFYSIIPEVAVHVTSITTKPTREFNNQYGLFIYRSCKENAFTGYYLLKYEGYKILIASREKALADFLYFNTDLDFDGERLDKRTLKKINWKRAEKYAQLFNRITVKKMEDCKDWSK